MCVVGAAIDVGDSLEDALAKSDTVIDFTSHHFSDELVAACLKHRKPLVMGTTGHTADELGRIREAAKTIPMVFAPNFSVGVNTLFWLTRQAARVLGEAFDLEVVEMHHRMKTDSPSGTARRLVEILCEESDVSYDKDTRHGRFGDVGARTKKEIGVHALRGGDVVGDHTVDLRQCRRTRRTHAQGQQPRHLRQRRGARGEVAGRQGCRNLRHAGRAGAEVEVVL